jgi:hypothetical protein
MTLQTHGPRSLSQLRDDGEFTKLAHELFNSLYEAKKAIERLGPDPYTGPAQSVEQARRHLVRFAAAPKAERVVHVRRIVESLGIAQRELLAAGDSKPFKEAASVLSELAKGLSFIGMGVRS